MQTAWVFHYSLPTSHQGAEYDTKIHWPEFYAILAIHCHALCAEMQLVFELAKAIYVN